MSNYSKAHVYAIWEHAYLLECTMATYEKLAGLKKQPKGELDRHESIIKDAVRKMGQEYLAVGDQQRGADTRSVPRLNEVLSGAKNGRTLSEAIEAWFNKVRYGVG